MSLAGRDRGSVLMLMPAALLVVIVLAAISVDQSLVFLRQRQAASVALDVANDLATAALDEARFRSTGRYELDAALAGDLAHELVAASDVAPHVEEVVVRLTGADEVLIELAVRVDYVFAGAIPGAPRGTVVRARAAAVAATGP